VAQAGLDFNALVFVDETGTTTSMTRLRGWGEKGKPLLGKAAHGHWMTSTPTFVRAGSSSPGCATTASPRRC
jgi:hypothetical protein